MDIPFPIFGTRVKVEFYFLVSFFFLQALLDLISSHLHAINELYFDNQS